MRPLLPIYEVKEQSWTWPEPAWGRWHVVPGPSVHGEGQFPSLLRVPYGLRRKYWADTTMLYNFSASLRGYILHPRLGGTHKHVPF